MTRSTLEDRLSILNSKGAGSAPEIDYEGDAAAFVQLMQAEIDSEVALLAAEAQETVNQFWELIKDRRSSTENKDDKTFLGVRVRLVKGTLSIEWFRNVILFDANKKTKGVISNRLKKGLSSSYPKSSFASEPEWLRPVIASCEEKFTAIRERAAILTQMKRELRKYEKLLKAALR